MHVSFFCILFVARVLARPQQVRLGPEKALDDGGFKMVLPIFDDEPFQRRREIERKQLGYLYGPSLLGNTSWFPTGSLGGAMVQEHEGLWWTDAEWLKNAVRKDAESAARALDRAGGLQKLEDYRHLYHGQWTQSVPDGPAPGTLENYTSDLLFAMERLSANPYSIRRLHPTAETLPFVVDVAAAKSLSGWSLEDLHRNGHLFVGDHGYQAKYPVTAGRYTAACTAYFYIHPQSRQFLPLAIKTNVGADLVYTPLDHENDWLLAKAMFNQNDLFHGQIFHLANSHAVTEIVHLAALRTLSDKHPVLVLLRRLMHQAYAIRPVGESVLFRSDGDGLFDQSFALNNAAVRTFATEFYPTVAGPFQSNYLFRDLASRGLVNCTYGPPLLSFPFLDDASVLHAAIRRFMTVFVDAYYRSPSPQFHLGEPLLALDYELQSWIAEASFQAGVIDFPSAPLTSRRTLIDILTHIAFLTGVSHHVLNSGALFTTSGILPTHPAALHSPLPTEKGIVSNLMDWLPPAEEAVRQLQLQAFFNRPSLVKENRTLTFLFSGSDELWDKGEETVKRAARDFADEMEEFSQMVKERAFDEKGLCMGMPMVWRALDPGEIPFFLSV